MNKNEFELLKEPLKKGVITHEYLVTKKDRTLLWGYTCDRESWHVYIKDLEIHVVKYGGYNSTPLHEVVVGNNMDFIPNKRLYPEACDYEFCKVLKRLVGAEYLPFTTWDDHRDVRQFYGEILG